MEITRKQLIKLISEHMLAPTFLLNREKRMAQLFRMLDDPNINPKLKRMLHSENEAEIKQAEELIATLHPEYAEEIDLYNSHQDSFEYLDEFERERERRQFASTSLKEVRHSMKLTKRQLKILINEAMKKPKNPMDYIEDEEQLKKMKSLLGNEDSSFADMAYQLASPLQKARPDKEQPDPELYTKVDLGYEGDDYLGDLMAYHESPEGILEFAKKIDQNYLPGFLKLPQEIINAVVAFVFLSTGPTLHIQLEEDILEEEIGQDMYDRATTYPSRNKPENADAVKIVDAYRNNPKAHDPKFYSIYAVGGKYKGVDPFTKIDPYLDPNSRYAAHRHGDSQSGFHDGFREEYHKVTTEPRHKISSLVVEEAIIRMMRDLRPDHQEYVIN